MAERRLNSEILELSKENIPIKKLNSHNYIIHYFDLVLMMKVSDTYPFEPPKFLIYSIEKNELFLPDEMRVLYSNLDYGWSPALTLFKVIIDIDTFFSENNFPDFLSVLENDIIQMYSIENYFSKRYSNIDMIDNFLEILENDIRNNPNDSNSENQTLLAYKLREDILLGKTKTLRDIFSDSTEEKILSR